jgi:outer membrane protein OmpA-like peptidoglycan-associated protein
MAKCGKCDPHEICEECPEWIFTLADLIMCMMGLFVILWVLKPGATVTPPPVTQAGSEEEERWLETVGEIRGGFGWVPDPASADPVDQAMIRKRERLRGRGEKGASRIEQKGAEGTDPEVTTIRVGQHATVGGRLLFERGDVSFTSETQRALTSIAREIRGHRNIVMIKGHASLDDFAEGGSAEQSMDLSLRRAQAVADFLIGQGVTPDILRVQGCSTFEPVAQRAYTVGAQANNRRVEVEATATLVEQLQDPQQRRSPNPAVTN